MKLTPKELEIKKVDVDGNDIVWEQPEQEYNCRGCGEKVTTPQTKVLSEIYGECDLCSNRNE